MEWHLAHPPKDNIDERVPICGEDGPVYAIWEHWKPEYSDSLCPKCKAIHIERLKDLGHRLKLSRGDK